MTQTSTLRAEGFAPDLISTDIWSTTNTGPAYDLPTVMTRMLVVGMALADVIAAATARARPGHLGTLRVLHTASVLCGAFCMGVQGAQLQADGGFRPWQCKPAKAIGWGDQIGTFSLGGGAIQNLMPLSIF